ncbi:hypothetical protein [Streptomyces aidingensis]|uniref:Uncharacterized protein n=1 Tax=Streptomyces aidingensis TaxID=910347 RepID=A0A1I1QY06_9ACTN|nr:hypothetical protein [Streptomyces aidingensis]SFD26867.1 hypothetical protein SAMN05421773_11270 [Streptomyces aidingensis]
MFPRDAVILLTGETDLVNAAWRHFTAALGTRLDVSLTMYEHAARVMANEGCTVISVELHGPHGPHGPHCRVRTVEPAPDGTWQGGDGHHCGPDEAVPMALAIVEHGAAAGTGGGRDGGVAGEVTVG